VLCHVLLIKQVLRLDWTSTCVTSTYSERKMGEYIWRMPDAASILVRQTPKFSFLQL
jgi:hypothetical protein